MLRLKKYHAIKEDFMPIWTYNETKVVPFVKSLGQECQIHYCPFCRTPLSHFAGIQLPEGHVGQYRGMSFVPNVPQELKVCRCCGWWVLTYIESKVCINAHDDGLLRLTRVCGSLKDLDLTDISTPTQELRAYLVGRYGERFSIHPKKYEDIVAGVFSDFGYQVRITSFSGDEGIDVLVFDGAGDVTTAIQVKRQRGKVKAEQLRAFVGALALRDCFKIHEC